MAWASFLYCIKHNLSTVIIKTNSRPLRMGSSSLVVLVADYQFEYCFKRVLVWLSTVVYELLLILMKLIYFSYWWQIYQWLEQWVIVHILPVWMLHWGQIKVTISEMNTYLEQFLSLLFMSVALYLIFTGSWWGYILSGYHVQQSHTHVMSLTIKVFCIPTQNW